MMFTFHISTLILMGIGCFLLGVFCAIHERSSCNPDNGMEGGIDGC